MAIRELNQKFKNNEPSLMKTAKMEILVDNVKVLLK
jgi:hypothetical protein